MPGMTDNTIVINASIDQVWGMTSDPESWPRYFSEYASVQVLDRRDQLVRFRITTHPDENGEVSSWVSEWESDRDKLTARGRRVEPGPFEFIDTHWEYKELPHGVGMRWTHTFAMRPTAPIDDAKMTDKINKDDKARMERIRTMIEPGA